MRLCCGEKQGEKPGIPLREVSVPKGDDLLRAVEAVHAAGLDEARWPHALGAVARLTGSACATLEVLARPNLQHHAFHGFNVSPINELTYIRDFAAMSPRNPFAARRRSGELIWDYQILDERGINRDPFYNEFLTRVDLRYFVGAILDSSEREFATLAVHRTRKQGHVGERERGLMQHLMPHMRQAYDVARRLRAADRTARSLAQALDWLIDGAMIVRADGKVLYANEAVREITRREEGLHVKGSFIEFAAAAVQARFNAALAAVVRMRATNGGLAAVTDFPMPRPSGGLPYLISLRPLSQTARSEVKAAPDAIVFVHDPLRRQRAALNILREVFGFTEAEAALAQALQAGVPVPDYARERALSLNTAYTHLRRIREKTGCNRMPDLIRKLNDVQVPLRTD
jgi:DNA-binding CsgD family transcriptional regulator